MFQITTEIKCPEEEITLRYEDIRTSGVYKDESDGTYLVVLEPDHSGVQHDALSVTDDDSFEVHFAPAWKNAQLTPTNLNLKVILEA